MRNFEKNLRLQKKMRLYLDKSVDRIRSGAGLLPVERMQGDETAVRTVRDAYEEIRTIYGRYYPQYKSKGYPWVFAIPFWAVSLMLAAFGIGLLCGGVIGPAVVMRIGSFASVFTTVGFFVAVFMHRQDVLEVWFEKCDGRTVTVYLKDSYLTAVAFGGGDVYLDGGEDWFAGNEAYFMEDCALFSQLVGELSIQTRARGETRIETRHSIDGADGSGSERRRGVSARMSLRDGKPVYLEYYPIGIDNAGMRIRSARPKRLEIIEINGEQAAEVPISFRSFCEAHGIYPPEETENLRYVDEF